MRRRTFVGMVGATSVSLSGCLSYFEENGENEVTLGWVAVDNFDTEPQMFELQVVRDGEQVHHSSEEVSGKTGGRASGHVAECTWNDSRGKYTVAARIEGGEWTEYTLPEDSTEDVECVFASFSYSRYDDEEFSLHTSENSTLDCTDIDGFRGGCPFANEM